MVNRMKHPWKSALVSALLALCTTAAMAAAPLMIWPVDPVITGSQRAVALWLENRGTAPVAMQVRVFRWSQNEGEDQFTAQQQVMASPPIAQIPPGRRQMVRLIATQAVAAGEEQAFRVLVDELPAQAAASADTGQDAVAAVQLQIRYAIPLFVYGPNTVPARLADARSLIDGTAVLEPTLSWQLVQQGGTPQLVVRNQGPSHARITEVGWAQTAHSVLSYVLPHSEVRLNLAAPPAQAQTLRATVNGRSAQLPRAPQ